MSDAASIRRGDVWWVELDPTRGAEIRKRRPAIVITADALCRARRTVVVVPVSSGPAARPPLAIPVPSVGPDSIAICDQLRAVDKGRLVAQAGRVTSAELRAVETGIRAVLVL